MLAVARALVTNPRIVEQYVDRALAVADYVYVLHKGRVAFVGEPAQCRAEDIFSRYLGSVA